MGPGSAWPRQTFGTGAHGLRQRVGFLAIGGQQPAQQGAVGSGQGEALQGGLAPPGRQRHQALEMRRQTVQGRCAHGDRATLSQARARRRSRSTVVSETARAAATSARLRPPK